MSVPNATINPFEGMRPRFGRFFKMLRAVRQNPGHRESTENRVDIARS